MKKFLYAIAVTLFMTITLGLTAMAAPSITPTLLNDFETSTENVSANSMVMPAGTKEMVYALNMGQKGLVMFDLSSTGLPSGITVQLFNNSACTNKVGYSSYLGTVSLRTILKVMIPVKGTYYLKFSRSSFAMDQLASFSMKAYCYSGDGKILGNKVWTGTYSTDYHEILYHKVVVKRTGYIKVEGYGQGPVGTKGNLYTTLYNSKKKAVSDQQRHDSSNNFSGYYGVKKGTYYIGIKYTGHYKLKYTFSAVKDKNISSKKKAATINRGKTAKGLITAGESTKKTEWYKLKLTSKKKLKIWLNAKAAGVFRLEVVPASSRVRVTGSISTYNTSSTVRSTNQKLPAGTYYLKISRPRNVANGYYTLRWK